VSLPRLLVFASGTEEGGGSGFVKLVEASRDGVLQAEIVGVVSNHTNGGVRQKADGLNVPFLHFDGPFNAQNYQDHVCNTQAEFVSLSGWLKLVAGLDPRMTINIHPGPLPYLGYTQDFGGPGMYGHHVHEAVMQAYHVGKLTESRVSMHFVTEKYDEGPVFFSILCRSSRQTTPRSLVPGSTSSNTNGRRLSLTWSFVVRFTGTGRIQIPWWCLQSPMYPTW